MSRDLLIEKVLAGERLSAADALGLWDLDLLTVGRLADRVRRRLHPEPVVTYVVDRNVNYTNICISGCRFCAFFRPPGHPEGYVLDRDTLRRKLEETGALGGTGVLLQGGLNPELPLTYYEDLVGIIRRSGLQVHGFSPPEIIFLAKQNGLSVAEVLQRLISAGLSSIPGGGAEILVDRVRRAISPNKCSVDEWLQVMKTAHGLGLRTTATMMFGHRETRADRVEHLLRLRDLQDQTGGFTAFIPWTFQPGGTALGGAAASALEYLKTLAISRLVLDNFPHLQVSWVTQGAKIAQVALRFGANDFGSTMIEENVVAATGVTYRLTREEIARLITDAGFFPQQRDHVYQLIGEGGGGAQPSASSPNLPAVGGEVERRATDLRSPGPPLIDPKLAVIARVGAHRDFLARGVDYEGGQRYETPFGLSNPVHLFVHEGLGFAVVSRHGEKGYEVSAPFVNDRANLYALKALGVEKILAWCAPGAINEAMAPGHLVVPHDVVDEGKGGPQTFFAGRGPGFIRHNPVFCPELRQVLIGTLAKSPFTWHPRAVYVATTGPRLETPAEIAKFRLLGGDLVGQTLVPEVFLARELEFCYAALCYVVNFAEGVKERPYQAGILFEGLATAEEMARVREVEGAFADLFLKLLPGLAATGRFCPCPKLMERYRLRGDLGKDWRTWFP
jgi:cyclic dehypoxanthinyl futalosine synthase